MKDIDLFIGVYPGGTVFCDKNHYKNGDYKELAFVRTYGQIKYSVKPEALPAEIIAAIENESRQYKAKFEKRVYQNMAADQTRETFRLLNYLPYDAVDEILKEKNPEKRTKKIIDAYEAIEPGETTA